MIAQQIIHCNCAKKQEIYLDTFIFTKSQQAHKVFMVKPTKKKNLIAKTWTALNRRQMGTFDSHLLSIKYSIVHISKPPHTNLMLTAKIICCFDDILKLVLNYALRALPNIYENFHAL